MIFFSLLALCDVTDGSLELHSHQLMEISIERDQARRADVGHLALVILREGLIQFSSVTVLVSLVDGGVARVHYGCKGECGSS